MVAGRVHEHHLEQEQREHADVVGVAAQEESFQAEQPERMRQQVDGQLVVERRGAAERADRADAAHLQRVAANPEAEQADRVDHEVHAHRVRGVLRAGEAGLHHREPGLHEHDEEPGKQRPHKIDRDLVVTDGFHDFGERRVRGVLDRHVLRRSGRRPGRIAFRGGLSDRALRVRRIQLPTALNTNVSSRAVSTLPINFVCRVIVSSPFVLAMHSSALAGTRAADTRRARDIFVPWYPVPGRGIRNPSADRRRGRQCQSRRIEYSIRRALGARLANGNSRGEPIVDVKTETSRVSAAVIVGAAGASIITDEKLVASSAKATNGMRSSASAQSIATRTRDERLRRIGSISWPTRYHDRCHDGVSRVSRLFPRFDAMVHAEARSINKH